MDGPQASARSGAVVAVLAFTGTVAAIMQTVVMPLLDQLTTLLHTSSSAATWVVTSTLLAAAVCTPVSGRLGDLYGKKPMLLVCCTPLLIGSVVCALSSSVAPMVVGRSLQGMGMGVVPLGISLLRDVLPRERLSSAIALVSASMGIGGGLGLPISAAVAQYFSWRVLFWGSAVLVAVILVLILTLVPSTSVDADEGGFDLLGALVLGAGLVCVLLAVSDGADWGWGSGRTLGTLIGGVVLLLAWGWWELRRRHPLVDLRVTARPTVLLTNLASILVGFGMYAQMLILPQLLELPRATGYGLGQSMLAMGCWMAPSGLMMMLASPFGGRLSARRGPKLTLIVGATVIACGYGLSQACLGAPWALMLAACVTNVGTGYAYGAMPALIMSSVPHSETASANSFNTLMRSLGTSVCSAVIGVVLAQLTTNFAGYALPSMAGFRIGMLIGCAVAVGAALVALAIPFNPTRAPAAQLPGQALPQDAAAPAQA